MRGRFTRSLRGFQDLGHALARSLRPHPRLPPLKPEGVVGIPLPDRPVLDPMGAPGPRRVLVIRLHALGDVLITLPLLAALRRCFPSMILDVLTDTRYASVFESRLEPHRVWHVDARAPFFLRTHSRKAVAAEMRRPTLSDTHDRRGDREPPFDLILDLQRSADSRWFLGALKPPHWVAFDRFAPRSALTRYLDAAAWVGLRCRTAVFEANLEPTLLDEARSQLARFGHEGDGPLIALNPAGLWTTRQWPLERYAALAHHLKRRHRARFLLLGAGQTGTRVKTLARLLPRGSINVVDMTSIPQAMALVAHCALMISEDSGLMHMAWTQGIPVLALFGSSRWVWSRPEGPHSEGWSSDDLECGNCLKPTCFHGDTLCLSRIEVEEVAERASALLASHRRSMPSAPRSNKQRADQGRPSTPRPHPTRKKVGGRSTQ